MSYNMYVPTRFIFGGGRLGELHSQKLPGKKASVVISPESPPWRRTQNDFISIP
ncbi:hypothetical protein [Youngiibacter multivorans]|uniref:Alcohol dehydrogenase n=1 Tax=Youngiibacter multivorans TaxID=937251 RepID=A0ABS4G977_9CLOT|nr:hypothetical protein [Youngiibacter multivorans]MBP1920825.1 hypothetical protein [Youngiibacter multivorans]